MIPSLKYNPKPKVFTGTELKEAIKNQKVINEAKIYQKNSKVYKDVVGRLHDREDAIFRASKLDQNNPTFKDKLELFRKQNLDEFSQKFGKQTIGVHGRELPKFFENNKEYWKSRPGYNESPAYKTSKQEDQEVTRRCG